MRYIKFSLRHIGDVIEVMHKINYKIGKSNDINSRNFANRNSSVRALLLNLNFCTISFTFFRP